MKDKNYDDELYLGLKRLLRNDCVVIGLLLEQIGLSDAQQSSLVTMALAETLVDAIMLRADKEHRQAALDHSFKNMQEILEHLEKEENK